MIKKFFLISFLFLFFPLPIFAQNDSFIEARIINVLDQKDIVSDLDQSSQTYQKLELLVTKGDLVDQSIIVENGLIPLSNPQIYHQNDRLILTADHDLDGNPFYSITDYVRRDSLLLLFLIFAVLVIFVAKWKGLSSLLSMALSFFIIFKFILPRLLTGSDPILIGILASLLIIPLTFYLSHGFSRKTTIAVFGTLVSLIVTALLAVFFVNLANLSGFASEEAGFLQEATAGSVNIKNLLISGIIIGLLGILDDITIAQSAIVIQLKTAAPDLKPQQLFSQSMAVGQDHIASMVNTLILVYAGAALPLLLLFIDNPQPFSQVINTELIADEIIRTLVASIGLVMAVPLTTFLAVFASKKQSS
ncbi:YibE/F family protein [Patescibacteria group bacterium]|nr:YibE/F family protein [Patescibacteria group bacterium]